MTNQTTLLSLEARTKLIGYLEREDYGRRFFDDDTLKKTRLGILLKDYIFPEGDSQEPERSQALEVIAEHPVELVVSGKPYLAHLGGYMLSPYEFGAICQADQTQQYPMKEGEL